MAALREAGDGTLGTEALRARAAAAADAAKQKEALRKTFDAHAKEGCWDKGATAKLIRTLNEQGGYWTSDFGAKVASSHAALTGSDARSAP